ncbi:MAG: OmpA family protein, partial [Nitrospinota bacterium]
MKKIYLCFLKILGNERGDESSFRMMNVSLNMILLAFFIVLNSMAIRDEKRILRALGSLSGSFGILSMGQNPLTKTGSGILPPSAPMAKIKSMRFHLLKKLQEFSLDIGVKKGFAGKIKGKMITLTLDQSLLFSPGSLKMTKEAKAILLQICDLLKKNNNPVMVRGYAKPPQGKEGKKATAWEISGKMSIAVLNFLTEKGGVAPERITIAGYGSSRPAFEDKL